MNQSEILHTIAAASDDRPAPFHGQVIGELELQGRTFDGPVNFSGAIFVGRADFSGAIFRQFASFDSAVFKQPSAFRGCRFERGATFSLATFQAVDFLQAQFAGRALFWRTFFLEPADFSQVKVRRAAGQPGEDAGEANFSWARFHGKAVFTYGEFETSVYLHRTLFSGDVLFEACKFADAVWLNGKQNEVLLPRFGCIAPETIRELELAGLFRPDTERHRTYRGQRLSEFVCFNDVLSAADLDKRLSEFSGITPGAKAAMAAEWCEGACKMFSAGHLVSFRGARFAALDRLSSAYLDFDGVVLDKQIAGSAEERRLFDMRLTANAFDVFVSHASEDKAELVRGLCAKLRGMGFAIWLDESALEIGDVLTSSLDEAMQKCRNGIIVLSPHYIKKDWTRYELERLLKLSEQSEKKLFFIWHNLKEVEVKAWSPQIADRLAYVTGQITLEALAGKLAAAMHRAG